jgi:hypothetical protein
MLLITFLVSVIATIFIIKYLFTFTDLFHWLELLCITLFCLSISSWSFNLYHSAYESLTVTAKYIEFFTAYTHFVILYPLLLVLVIRLFKKSTSFYYKILGALLWMVGYLLLLEFDIYLGVFKVKYSHWYPILITTSYNIISIFATVLFMKKFSQLLTKERKING